MSADRPTRALAVLALAALLAGCAQPASPPAATEDARHDATGGEAAGAFAATFPGTVAFERALFFNGSLKLQQANRVGGAPVGQPIENSVAQFDVSSLVPKGVPITMIATLVADAKQGDLRLWFTVPDGQNRHGGGTGLNGGNKISVRGLVRTTDSPIVLNLLYRTPEPAAELPYAIVVRTSFDPAAARSCFPIGIAVPEGVGALTFELVGEEYPWLRQGEAVDLMLWAPDDAFLGHTALTAGPTTIPLPDLKGGEYVALLEQGGRSMRVLTSLPNATLRALPQDFVVEPVNAATTAKGAEWTTTYARVPELAGFVFTMPNAASGARVSLATPKGPLYAMELPVDADNVYVSGGRVTAEVDLSSTWSFDSLYGVKNLVAGAYHAKVSFEQGAGVEPIKAWDVAAFWKRAAK